MAHMSFPAPRSALPDQPSTEHDVGGTARAFALRSRCTLLPTPEEESRSTRDERPSHYIADAIVIVCDGVIADVIELDGLGVGPEPIAAVSSLPDAVQARVDAVAVRAGAVVITVREAAAAAAAAFNDPTIAPHTPL